MADQKELTRNDVDTKTKSKPKVKMPSLHKVILLNDDYTPFDFVCMVLQAVFRVDMDKAAQIMLTAHQQGRCVIACYTKDVAESKAKEATDLGNKEGHPLLIVTEPEE